MGLKSETHLHWLGFAGDEDIATQHILVHLDKQVHRLELCIRGKADAPAKGLAALLGRGTFHLVAVVPS